MKRFFLFVFSIVFFLSCSKQEKKQKENIAIDTSSFKEVNEISSLDFEGLEPYLSTDNDKTYVVNFWATWCTPCIKELPYFEFINQEYKNKDVEVILVSLDFPNQVEKRLIPYINKKKLQSTLLHLDDTNEQVWIAKVDENWSGAIPATIIFNKNKRKFYEQSFTLNELKKELKQFITN